MIKHVSRRGREEGDFVPLASFQLDGARLVATYYDAAYRDGLEQRGVAAAGKTMRPADGSAFFDALDGAYAGDVDMSVYRVADSAPAGTANLAGNRCPRCHYKEVVGRHRTFGERTIQELFCPRCELQVVADSDRPTYAEVIAHWHPVPVA
jgi:hypothetical protein